MNTTTSKSLIIICLTLLIAGCDEFSKNRPSETEGIFEEINPMLNFQFVSQEDEFEIVDSVLTATAEFIAGIPNEALPYARQRHYYQVHLAETKQFRKQVIDEQIIPMRNWAKEYNISEKTDSVTLFYPYGEGDFLKAYTLFPNCENYILTGTKPIGKFPDLQYTPDPILEDYLTQVRENLKISKLDENIDNQNIKSNKYFQTQDNIHQILVNLAQAGRKIISISKVIPNSFGDDKIVTENTEKSLSALKIEFCGINPKEKQKLYYFNISLLDSALKKQQNFERFLTEKQEKITFLHSDNYNLHFENHDKIRRLILNQSIKIVGDESGIPFAYLNDSDFKVKLYGVPSSAQKNIFRTNWKKGIEYEETGDLPFELATENRLVTALLVARLYPESTEPISPQSEPNPKIRLAEVSVNHLPAPTVSAPKAKIEVENADNQIIEMKKEVHFEIEKPVKTFEEKPLQKAKIEPQKTVKKTIQKSTKKVAPKSTKKKVITIGKTADNLVRYKVQIGIFSEVPNPKNNKLQGLPKLDFYKSNGNYRYTAGNEKNHSDCKSILQKVKNKGFSGAFIIAFKNGKRISINDAQKQK